KKAQNEKAKIAAKKAAEKAAEEAKKAEEIAQKEKEEKAELRGREKIGGKRPSEDAIWTGRSWVPDVALTDL
ncbi:hypothetical protein ACFL96_11860, partial [Thermoproteota archaeon]